MVEAVVHKATKALYAFKTIFFFFLIEKELCVGSSEGNGWEYEKSGTGYDKVQQGYILAVSPS